MNENNLYDINCDVKLNDFIDQDSKEGSLSKIKTLSNLFLVGY